MYRCSAVTVPILSLSVAVFWFSLQYHVVFRPPVCQNRDWSHTVVFGSSDALNVCVPAKAIRVHHWCPCCSLTIWRQHKTRTAVLDQLWTAFAAWETKKTLAIWRAICFSLPPTSGTQSYAHGRSSCSSARNQSRSNHPSGHRSPSSAGHPIVTNVSPANPNPLTACYSAWLLNLDRWKEVLFV